MTPTVSVIIPSYKHQDYIERAVRSVLNQGFEDLELIVVDDCSPDASWQVLNEIQDSRLHIYRNERTQGASAAYNRALELAQGELLMGLGSDDEFLPGKIERQVEFHRQNPQAGIVATHIAAVDPSGDSVADIAQWFNIDIDFNQADSWVWQNRICHSSASLTSQAHRQLGPLRSGLPRTLDWDQWLRAVTSGIRITVIPEELTLYRVQAGSVTHADPTATVLEYIGICREYWNGWLADSDRIDLVQQNTSGILSTYRDSSDEARQRLAPAVIEYLGHTPGVAQQLIDLTLNYAELAAGKDWLKDQWKRQEQLSNQLAKDVRQLRRALGLPE